MPFVETSEGQSMPLDEEPTDAQHVNTMPVWAIGCRGESAYRRDRPMTVSAEMGTRRLVQVPPW
jgi:hypothetical protein